MRGLPLAAPQHIRSADVAGAVRLGVDYHVTVLWKCLSVHRPDLFQVGGAGPGVSDAVGISECSQSLPR